MEHKEKYATECSYTMKLSMVRITWKKRNCNEVILTFKVSFKSCMMTTQTDRERMIEVRVDSDSTGETRRYLRRCDVKRGRKEEQV